MQAQNQKAVIIILAGQGLEDEVYRNYDLSTLEDLLIEEIEPDGIGMVDGHETGPMETTIYLYGSDAEKILLQGAACFSQLSSMQKQSRTHPQARSKRGSARDNVSV